ncbi:MAG: STE24 endopeptidase, partial [Sulfurimonas sp.]
MLMTVVTIYTLFVLISVYTSVMQIAYVNQAKKKKAVLLMSADFLKAGNYSVAKEKMSIISSFIDYILFIAWMGFGISYLSNNMVFENDAIMNIAIVMSFIIINSIISLPFSYYEKFV